MHPTRLLRQDTVLLVVDVQERLAPAMPEFDYRRALAGVELLVETARAYALPVVFTEQYPRGLGPTVPTLRALLETFAPPAMRFEKTAFSAAAVPAVGDALAAFARKSIVVVGMEAHVCVFQTARDLAATGLQVHVPADAVVSRDPSCRQTALALLSSLGVAVTTTESAVFDLIGDARDPHFKTLSERVKALPLPVR